MIPSTTYSTPSLPTHTFPRRPLSANLSSPPPSSLAQRRRNNKNLSLCLLPSDVPIPPSTPFLSPTTTTTTSTSSLHTMLPLLPSRHYYANGPIAILPGLYLGDEQNANNIQQLKELNIHAILNVASEVPPPSSCSSFQFQTFEQVLINPSILGYKKRGWHHHIMDEDDSEDGTLIRKELQETVMDVIKLRQAGLNILVHCQCGLARSATVVIAYVMTTLKLPMSASIQLVKQKAPQINPNLSLMYQLREYEHSVIKRKSPPFKSLIRRPWWLRK